MSGRSRHYNNNYNNKDGTDDDVESFRQRSRQNDRRYREDGDNEPGYHTSAQFRRNTKTDDEAEAARKKKLAMDREQRMARLREEIKKEDETLAALDKKQQQQNEGSETQGADDDNKISPQEAIVEVKPEELEGLDEEEQMRKLLGFNGFGSTKGEAVADNQSTAARGGAAKNKARKYRQYMNRKSGFNRPLEKMK